MVTGNENKVLSELHKTVYATGLKLHFKLLRLNYIFKTGGRNEFLTPTYPRIEVLVMIVAPEDHILH